MQCDHYFNLYRAIYTEKHPRFFDDLQKKLYNYGVPKQKLVYATNSDYLIPIAMQPNVEK